MVFIIIMTLLIIINILIIIHIIIIVIICTTISSILMMSSRTESGGDGPIDGNSPAEPKGEAEEGRLYNGGGEGDSHAGQDDNGSKVLDSLVGLLFLTSFFFSVFTPKLRNTTNQW